MELKAGDKVIYLGVLAKIESIGETFAGTPTYDLVSIDNPEMTCTAMQDKCSPYDENNYDEEANNKALENAEMNSQRITNLVGGLTDKYFRDGNH